jgi:RNA polymerase sigma-70 factor (ECF subfamily)
MSGKSGGAFNQAALAHLDSVYSYAASLTHNAAQADAVVQETYRCAARAFSGLVPGSDLRSSLYAIVRNIWLNQVRWAEGRQRFAKLREDRGGADAQADRPGIEGVRAALERLPRPHREVIVLREFEGLSYCEIANIVHCPAGTVYSRLDRARQRLRPVLSVCTTAAPQLPTEVDA